MIPEIYPLTTERSIASYDYFDIAEGTGIKTFFGLVQNMSGSNVYAMSGTSLPSSLIETIDTSNQTRNFDLAEFNSPKIIKGTASVAFSAELDTGLGGAGDIYFSIRFAKVDENDVATNISSEIFTQSISRGSAGTTFQSFNIAVELTTTKFKIGEKIRMIFKSYSVAAAEKAIYGHDPENRAGTNLSTPAMYPTTMHILIPFKLNVE